MPHLASRRCNWQAHQRKKGRSRGAGTQKGLTDHVGTEIKGMMIISSGMMIVNQQK